MLEAHDEGIAGLSFGCLLSQIILQSGINIDGEPRMKIKQPLSKQTLMKSNAQLRRDESDDDMLTAMHVAFPEVASSSYTVPPSEPGKFFSGHGGLSCYSGRDDHHAAIYLLHAAGNVALWQKGGANPSGPSRVPPSPSSR